MSRIYDNWERLVEATLKREHDRELAYCESLSSGDSDFSSDSFREDVAVSLLSLRRERDREIALWESFSSIASSDLSFDSFCEDIASPNAKSFSFPELRRATENFQRRNCLGQGAFNSVYKGWIDLRTLNAAKPGSGLAIAVNKFGLQEFQGHKELLAKVNYLEQLHHPNLVKLIGYCSEDDNRLLVYEFMPKGSLENHLFRRGLSSTMSWETRINVAIGVATGLSFLHNRDPKMIHGDVKSSSILLDEDFSTKLSGFTLTEFEVHFDPRYEIPSPPYRLANGYDAPESIVTGMLTAKCDVYSFGVVLLELLSGRRAVDKTKISIQQNIVHWAKPYMGDKRKLFWIMDTKLKGQYPKKRAYTVATLALQCVSLDPEQRPHMEEVLGALQKLQNRKQKSPSFLLCNVPRE